MALDIETPRRRRARPRSHRRANVVAAVAERMKPGRNPWLPAFVEGLLGE